MLSDVISALGFTPYNATNPNGYITASGSITGNAATATNVAYSGLTGTVPTWNQNTTGTASNITGTYQGSISSAQVITGLGFTPYNSTNPNSYISQAQITALPLSQLAATLDMGTLP